jgi:hypothetical protein
MNWISFLLGYLLIGAVLGLFHEERNHRRHTSQRSRSLVDYVFSASVWAILWPVGFVLTKEGRE